MKKIIHIQNLKCSGCEKTIMNALMKINGVQNAAVHLDDSSVSLTCKNDDVFGNVQTRLAQIGYPLVGDKNTMMKKAASYVSCAIGKINYS